MPRSELSLIKERLTKALDPSRRLVDIAVQLEVWKCKCGHAHAPTDPSPDAFKRHIEFLRGFEHEPIADYRLGKVYGGKYDTLAKRYVGRADNVVPIKCHEGQLPLLTFNDPSVVRLVSLGSPGAGKTFGVVRRAAIEVCKWPNTMGGLVAPTDDRRQILWRDFLELLEPLGWIDDISYSRKEIRTVNNVIVQILAAKKSSSQAGSPLAGRSWFWAMPDESQNIDYEAHDEILARGRRAGIYYRVYETATNAEVPAFRVRLEQLRQNPGVRILRFTGHQNPWVSPEWWETMRKQMSERRFRQFVLAEDVPPELLLYPEFNYQRHVRGIPAGARDVTADLVFKLTQHRDRHFIGAQDFGRLVHATIILKCFEVLERSPTTGDKRGKRIWVACDEITSGEAVTADYHAKRVIRSYDPSKLLIIADPHRNTADEDKADYAQFQRAGLAIIPASPTRIAREHRYDMVNSVLRDDQLFILPGKCPKLVESFMGMERNELGEGERDRKDSSDLSHWTAALGYGLYPFERIRGNVTIRSLK